MKAIIESIKIKKFINQHWHFFIISLANYKVLVNRNEILENYEYENQLLTKIKFLGILKD